jgi:hypothetical protein
MLLCRASPAISLSLSPSLSHASCTDDRMMMTVCALQAADDSESASASGDDEDEDSD